MTRKAVRAGAGKREAKPRASAWSLRTSLPLLLLVVALAVGVQQYLQLQSQGTTHKRVTGSTYLSRKEPVDRLRYDVKCHRKKKYKGYVPGCYPIGDQCGRAVRDQFITPQEVLQVREIAEIGMANRSKLGGPTIMDVNTGYVKDGDGLVNIYQSSPSLPPTPRFTAEQFALYRR